MSWVMPSMFIGGRNPGHTRLGTAGCAPAHEHAVSEALITAAESIAAEHGLASAGVLYVDEDDQALRKLLANRGYTRFLHGEAAWLDIPGNSFEDYIDALPRKSRQTVHSDLRKLGSAGVTFRCSSLNPGSMETVVNLVAKLSAKYGAGFSEETTYKQLEAIRELFGDNAAVAMSLLDDRVCGAVVILHWRNSIFLKFGGFDYQLQGRLPIYFGLLFYYMVQYAHANSVDRINYSTGSARTKLSRGCSLVGQYAYVKMMRPDLNDRLLESGSSFEVDTAGREQPEQ